MKTTTTTTLRRALTALFTLALATTTLCAGEIRIGDTPARRIAKDRTIPGKGVPGECLTYAKALHAKFQAAGVPSKVVTFGYATTGLTRTDAKGARAHAVVVYDDNGRTYVADNQTWLPTWVANGPALEVAQRFAGLDAYVTNARVAR